MRFVVDWGLFTFFFFVPLVPFFEQFLAGAFFAILIEIPFIFSFLGKLYVCFGGHVFPRVSLVYIALLHRQLKRQQSF